LEGVCTRLQAGGVGTRPAAQPRTVEPDTVALKARFLITLHTGVAIPLLPCCAEAERRRAVGMELFVADWNAGSVDLENS
jgi:hypothetical protein